MTRFLQPPPTLKVKLLELCDEKVAVAGGCNSQIEWGAVQSDVFRAAARRRTLLRSPGTDAGKAAPLRPRVAEMISW